MQILSIKLYFHCFITPQLLLFIFPDLAHGKNRGHLSLLKMPLKSSTHLLLNFCVTHALGKICRVNKANTQKKYSYIAIETFSLKNQDTSRSHLL